MAGYNNSNPLMPSKVPAVCCTLGTYPINVNPTPAAKPAIDCAIFLDKLNTE